MLFRSPAGPGVALVGGLDPLLEMAMKFRNAGVRVLALAADTPDEKARRLAMEAGLWYLALPDGDGLQVEDLRDGGSSAVGKDEISAWAANC